MSLYRTLFGENYFANFLLSIYEIDKTLEYIQYRDIYIHENNIWVFTGNTDDNSLAHDYYTSKQYYLKTENDYIDKNIRYYIYSIPTDLVGVCSEIESVVEFVKVGDKLNKLNKTVDLIYNLSDGISNYRSMKSIFGDMFSKK